MSKSGFVHSFETLGALDGPGVRFVVFLQGCPLRCAYCHNPDTWKTGGEGAKVYAAEELVAKIKRYKPYFGKEGGVTLSGGEPLLQGDFCAALISLLKEENIHTAIDTSGTAFHKEAVDRADLIILDIKHTGPDEYKKLTGYSIAPAIEFLEYCKATQKPLWIRQVILPGITDGREYIKSLAEHIKGLNIKKIELLPYHTLGVHKYEKLGIPYKLKDMPTPKQEEVEALYNFLKTQM
jgi:pyruvate formate lyase activating enzyme